MNIFSEALVFKKKMNIEKIAWMLSVQCSADFSGVEIFDADDIGEYHGAKVISAFLR